MSKKPKEIQITTIDYADFVSRFAGDYPAKFVFKCGLGFYNFIHTSKKSIAVEYVKENYDGKYEVREV